MSTNGTRWDALSILGMIATVFVGAGIFIGTFPSSLLVVLGGCVLAVALNPRLRRKAIVRIIRDRTEFLFALAIVSCVLFLMYTSVNGFIEVQWCLPSVILGALCLRSWQISLEQGSRSAFQKALCSNFLELLIIAAIVLSLYTAVLCWFQSIPVENIPVKRLQKWDELIELVHCYSEKYEPGIAFFVALMAVAWGVRFAQNFRPNLVDGSGHSLLTLVKGAKWMGRACTVITMMAALTLLSTSEKGPEARIELTLKDATRKYEELRAVIARRLDQEIQQILLEQVLSHRPPTLSQAMNEAAHFEDERRQFRWARQAAHKEYHLDFPIPTSFPSEADFPNRSNLHPKVVALEDSWTLDDLKRATDDAKNATSSQPAATTTERTEAIDEISKGLLAKLLEHLSEGSAVIEVMKLHYPVYGEIIGAIADSISETALKSLSNDTVDRIISKWRSKPQDFTHLIMEGARTSSKASRPRLERFDGSWGSQTHVKVTEYRDQVAAAMLNLDRAAGASMRKRNEEDRKILDTEWKRMVKVGSVTKDRDIQKKAQLFAIYISRLERLEYGWSTLHDPTEVQIAKLRNLVAEIRRDLPESETKAVPPLNDYGIENRLFLQPIFDENGYNRPTAEDVVSSLLISTSKSEIHAVIRRVPMNNVLEYGLKDALGESYDDYAQFESKPPATPPKNPVDPRHPPAPPGIPGDHPADVHPDHPPVEHAFK